MKTGTIQEFKRLFYKLYFEDMSAKEIAALAMSIDQLGNQMIEEADNPESLKELSAELDAYGHDIRELVE